MLEIIFLCMKTVHFSPLKSEYSFCHNLQDFLCIADSLKICISSQSHCSCRAKQKDRKSTSSGSDLLRSSLTISLMKCLKRASALKLYLIVGRRNVAEMRSHFSVSGL